MIGLYLFAIVCANLSVAWFGPRFVVINCFFFIGFDLIARDALHERWHGQYLRRNMLLMIFAGSVLSAVFSIQAAQIAVASFLSFFLAGLVDTAAYARLWDRARLVKMNGSNIPTGIVDSTLFVVLAFGFPVLWDVIGLAIVSKIIGGIFWSVIVTQGHRFIARGLVHRNPA